MGLTYKDISLDYLISKDPNFFDSEEFKKHEAIFDRIKKDSPLLEEPINDTLDNYSRFIPFLKKFIIQRYLTRKIDIQGMVDFEFYIYLVMKGKSEIKKRKNNNKKDIFIQKNSTKMDIIDNYKLYVTRSRLPNNLKAIHDNINNLNVNLDNISNVDFKDFANVSKNLFSEIKFLRSSPGIDVYNIYNWKHIEVNKYLKNFYNDSSNINYPAYKMLKDIPDIRNDISRISIDENVKMVKDLTVKKYLQKINKSKHINDLSLKESLINSMFNRINDTMEMYTYEKEIKTISNSGSLVFSSRQIVQSDSYILFIDKNTNKYIKPISRSSTGLENRYTFANQYYNTQVKIIYICDSRKKRILNSREIKALCKYNFNNDLFFYYKFNSMYSPNKFISVDIEGINEGAFILISDFRGKIYEPLNLNISTNTVSFNIPNNLDICEIFIVPMIIFNPEDTTFVITTNNVLEILKNKDFYNRNYKSWMLSK